MPKKLALGTPGTADIVPKVLKIARVARSTVTLKLPENVCFPVIKPSIFKRSTLLKVVVVYASNLWLVYQDRYKIYLIIQNKLKNI